MHMSLDNLAARPLVALLAFAAWTVLLVLCIFGVRTLLVFSGQKRPNEFQSGVQHGGDRYWRLNRAHMNAVENLAVFAVIVLAGAALGIASPRLGQLAWVVVIARVAQSIFHVASNRSRVVLLRSTAFVTQLVCFVWMIVETVKLATS
jgi:uncharacterized MAPEG superfamily protein